MPVNDPDLYIKWIDEGCKLVMMELPTTSEHRISDGLMKLNTDVVADIITHIVNCSLHSMTVPSQ